MEAGKKKKKHTHVTSQGHMATSSTCGATSTSRNRDDVDDPDEM